MCKYDGTTKDDKNRLLYLPTDHYDIIVFSLLLSYIPNPTTRWQMCERAYRLLKTNGILILVMPDSNPQNKYVSLIFTISEMNFACYLILYSFLVYRSSNLVSHWKITFEKLGFQRIKYHKDVHLHLITLRKVPNDYLWDTKKITTKSKSTTELKSRIPRDIIHDNNVVYMAKDFSIRDTCNNISLKKPRNNEILPPVKND